MINEHLLFSEKKSHRIRRHLLFWIIWGIYFISLHLASPSLSPKDSYFNNLPFTITEGILIFGFLIPICYLTIYVILPIYTQQKKIVRAVLYLFLSWITFYYFYQWAQEHLFPLLLKTIVPEKYLPETTRPASIRRFMGLQAVLLGAFTNTVFVAGFRYIKQWYMKEQRNIQLQKENTESQLQLLTAQVHPHFLFNTLNNIYSQTQTESPKGSKMIMELSDMLRYILTEGNKTLVPLKKELAMIQDYINLERIRYGNKLDLHLSVPDDTGQLQIAPLLLLPFIENCFKHGASNFLNAPWINLKIEIIGRELNMKLMNGKVTGHQKINNLGTGIGNVKKRLALLYPGRHELQINDETEIFIVNLKLDLTIEKYESAISKTESNLSYA